MVEWHTKSKRLPSGGIRTTRRKSTKKNAWRGGSAANTKVDEKEIREAKHGAGKTRKVRARATKYANVFDKGAKKAVKAEILEVESNDANRLFARANIITKGAKIRVKMGSDEKMATVTSRPGQSGTVNAVLE
jgi:small subunit ribosomal protein S8e